MALRPWLRLFPRATRAFACLWPQDTGEMCCLITDLLDHVACPAGQLAAAYAWRWSGRRLP